jgi:hypothetical protein
VLCCVVLCLFVFVSLILCFFVWLVVSCVVCWVVCCVVLCCVVFVCLFVCLFVCFPPFPSICPGSPTETSINENYHLAYNFITGTNCNKTNKQYLSQLASSHRILYPLSPHPPPTHPPNPPIYPPTHPPNYSIATLHWPPSRVILFGRSIGTGPATRLASELCEANRPPHLLILQSPYRSIKVSFLFDFCFLLLVCFFVSSFFLKKKPPNQPTNQPNQPIIINKNKGDCQRSAWHAGHCCLRHFS